MIVELTMAQRNAIARYYPNAIVEFVEQVNGDAVVLLNSGGDRGTVAIKPDLSIELISPFDRVVSDYSSARDMGLF